MRLDKRLRILAVTLLMALVAPSLIQAASTEASPAASMESRLPELMELKLSGKVGETRFALVEARESVSREARHLISAENADRMAHYTLIAERLNLPVRTVQLKRAEQIRENSPKAVWVESITGEWSRN